MKKTLTVLSFALAAAMVLYWVAVFSGALPVEEEVPGYTNWYMSYWLPDLWIGAAAGLAGLLLVQGRAAAVPFGIAAGSSLVFLAVQELLYLIDTELLFRATSDLLRGLIGTVVLVGVGTLLMVQFWRIRSSLA